MLDVQALLLSSDEEGIYCSSKLTQSFKLCLVFKNPFYCNAITETLLLNRSMYLFSNNFKTKPSNFFWQNIKKKKLLNAIIPKNIKCMYLTTDANKIMLRI